MRSPSVGSAVSLEPRDREQSVTLQLVRKDQAPSSAELCLLEATDPNQFLDRLAGAELEHLRSFESPKRRQEFILGRYAAKLAAARLLGISDLTRLEIQPGIFSQPILRCLDPVGRAELPEVSITHSGAVAVAIAFQRAHPMGIDFEIFSSRNRNVLASNIASSEFSLLSELRLDEVTRGTLLWTVKESLSKTLKTGLMTPFSVFEIESVTAMIGSGRSGRPEVKTMPGLPASPAFVSTFRNFAQYQSLSWISSEGILSLTLPKNTQVR